MSEKTLDVLVVEHDPIIQELIRTLLSGRFPCRVDSTSHMDEALRLVRDNLPYRLVILEPYGLAGLPEGPKDLIEAVKGRQTEERKTHIVIVSALSLGELREDYGIRVGDFDLYTHV